MRQLTRPHPRFHYIRERDRHLKRLRKLLSLLPSKIDWLEASWVLDRGRMDKGFQKPTVYDFPEKLLFARIGESGAVHGWETETLITECLAVSLTAGRRALNVKSWNAISVVVTALRAAGNSESGLREPGQILREVGRVLTRQLPWQVHNNKIDDFGRWWSIFNNSPRLKEIFQQRVGVTFEKFITIGMLLNLNHNARCYTPFPSADLELLISDSDIAAFMSAVSMTLEVAEQTARQIVSSGAEIDYRRSNLRGKPIVELSGGSGGRKFIRPIEQLLIWRITSGLYYDVIGDKFASNEIGHQYERYTRRLLTKISEVDVDGDIEYGSARNPRRTPDCLVHRSGSVELVVECKAKRQSLAVQSAIVDTAELKSAIDELARGAVQLCRFERDVQAGMIGDLSLTASPVFLLVTLDDWIFTGPNVRYAIFESAKQIAKKSGEVFDRIDKERIAICTATELDELASCFSYHDILQICRAGFEERVKNYSLISVARDTFSEVRRPPSYPLAEELDNLLGSWITDRDNSQQCQQS